MDQAIKARWVEALRSGKYQQTKGRLRRGNNFCCLGVLCDLIDPERWGIDEHGAQSHRGERGLPAIPLCIGIGLREPNELSAMNDHGASFAEIAAFIEQNL